MREIDFIDNSEIDELCRTSHPECYNPNNDTHPLCKGTGEDVCNYCCLYENMIEPYDYN